MTRDETRGEIDLSLPIEGFEQSDTLLFGQNRQEIAERSKDRHQLLEAARTHEIRGGCVREQSSPAIVAELLVP